MGLVEKIFVWFNPSTAHLEISWFCTQPRFHHGWMCVARALQGSTNTVYPFKTLPYAMQHKHYLLSIICSSLRGLGRPLPEPAPCVQYINLQ